MLVVWDLSQYVLHSGSWVNIGSLAGAYERIYDCRTIRRCVIATEQIILPTLCWQYHYVGIVRYIIVPQRVGILAQNIMFGILRQVIKWAGARNRFQPAFCLASGRLRGLVRRRYCGLRPMPRHQHLPHSYDTLSAAHLGRWRHERDTHL